MARVTDGGNTQVAPTAKNYFTEFLEALHLPVTQANLNALYGVAQLEGWNNRYNPLNVIQQEPGSTSYNSVGVQSYADFDSGVKGAATLFSNGHWAGVRAALAQGNNAQGVLDAFKQAYTWDPGVQFPMGNPSWGDKVIGGSGGSGVVPDVALSNSGGDYPTTSSTAKMTAADYYGVDSLGRLLSSIPELAKLVDKAVAGNWSTDKFQNEVENSAWYRTHSDTARSVLVQQANDPAAYHQRFANAYNAVSELSKQLGFRLTMAEGDAIATNALLTGNDSDQAWLTQQIGQHENYSKVTNLSGMQGQMAQTTQQLQQMFQDYGYNHAANYIAEAAQNIVDGNTTIDTYKQQIMSWAKSAFPALAQQIDEGQTVKDLATPYVQSMSQLLEVDPNTLSVFTPAIRQAMQGTVDPGSKVKEATPLWQFENQVRQDPRWAYTQNAKDTMSTALLKIGSDFGFGPTG